MTHHGNVALARVSVVFRGARHTAEGLREDCADALVNEHFLTITVNGETLARLSCTPNDLAPMTIGRLYTGGIIDDAGQVAQITVTPQADRVEIALTEGLNPARRIAPAPLTPVTPDDEAVFELARRFSEDSALHRSTSGTHSCYLRLPDGSVTGFEDISRHNAMDKAVGHMLLAGADPAQCMLYTTGRVPMDMVEKVVMARVPVLVSKSVPTDAGVRMAARYGLALLCRAWPDSYVIYQGEA